MKRLGRPFPQPFPGKAASPGPPPKKKNEAFLCVLFDLFLMVDLKFGLDLFGVFLVLVCSVVDGYVLVWFTVFFSSLGSSALFSFVDGYIWFGSVWCIYVYFLQFSLILFYC